MRGFVAVLVLILFGLCAPAAHAIDIPPTQEDTSTSQLRGQVRKLVINSDSGDVIVNAAQPASVKKTERWVYDRPSVKMTFVRGVLTITSRCPNTPLNNCSVDLTANITRSSTVEVVTADGLVRVSNIASSLVSGKTSNGPVYLSDVSAETLKGQTSNGDVAAKLTSAPADTSLRSNNGHITARVPRGTYTLDVRTSSGDVHISGISNRRNSGHMLSARTSNGDVTIAGK